jgi:hypothetical protein
MNNLKKLLENFISLLSPKPTLVKVPVVNKKNPF